MSKKSARHEAIQKILGESPRLLLTYREIAERIEKTEYRNLWDPHGKPSLAQRINIIIADSIRNEGEKSPYQKIEGIEGKGIQLRHVAVSPKAAKTPKVAKTLKVKKAVKRRKKGGKQDVLPIISSYGLKWERKKGDWKKPKRGGEKSLYGKEKDGKVIINFWKQRGIYILHNSEDKIVYVGESTKGSIGSRLSNHANDVDLVKEWDKFSWFGFCPIVGNEPGDLPEVCRIDDLIPVLEAIFIELLNPPENYKKGAKLRGRQYEQIKIEKNTS